MKVKCISQCQTDRNVVYEAGKEYDIPEKLYNANKERFEKTSCEKVKKDGQR